MSAEFTGAIIYAGSSSNPSGIFPAGVTGEFEQFYATHHSGRMCRKPAQVVLGTSKRHKLQPNLRSSSHGLKGKMQRRFRVLRAVNGRVVRFLRVPARF